jgi:diaminohydroxyphosphoribosylaminopyrimidine deaminase / 5-amino-6-(5-phosphoribosylamino)uracil reductase
VGSETAIIDDPLLTVRGETGPRIMPVRIVFDTGARLPTGSRLLQTLADAPVLVVCAPDAESGRVTALEQAGATVVAVERDAGGLALERALRSLWDRQIRSILCEGGGRLAAALLAAGLVDWLHLLIAPRLLGSAGVPAFPLGGPPPGEWRLQSVTRLGEDVAIEYGRVRDGST